MVEGAGSIRDSTHYSQSQPLDDAQCVSWDGGTQHQLQACGKSNGDWYMTLVRKHKILVFCDYYLPGYKAGGPIRSIANIVEGLGDKFHFKIVTRDRDYNESLPYNRITANTWLHIGKADVMYLEPCKLQLRHICQLLRHTSYDLLYLNSFFSPIFTIQPLLLRKFHAIPRRPILLAPRGEFSPGHLELKRQKYLLYIFFAKILGLYKDICWHASTLEEKNDIERWFRLDKNVFIASNPPHAPSSSCPEIKMKRSGELRIVFLSRIVKKKNLKFVLELVEQLNGNVNLSIYGITADKEYWNECNQIIRKANKKKNIHIEYFGDVPHEKVAMIFADNHVLFLPTLGENFGHVIFEALAAGRPVIISDQTPWRNLERKGIGWDIPLNRKDYFLSVLQKLIAMKQEEYASYCRNAWNFAMNFWGSDSLWEQNIQLFEQAIQFNSRDK